MDDDLVATMEAMNMNNEVEEKMLALKRARDRERKQPTFANYDYRRDSGMGIFLNQDLREHPFDMTALPDDIEETILNMARSTDYGPKYAAANDEVFKLMRDYDALNIRAVTSQSQRNYDKFYKHILNPLWKKIATAGERAYDEQIRHIGTQNVIQQRLVKKAEDREVMKQLQRRRSGIATIAQPSPL